MPPQCYHYGIAKIIYESGTRVTDFDKFTIGNLCVDPLRIFGGRSCSHFCRGSGMIVPRYEELKNCTDVQHWSNEEASNLYVDPMPNQEMFYETNHHLGNDDYSHGIEAHLWADYCYNVFLHKIFSFTETTAMFVHTGEEMTREVFKKNMYEEYPKLDMFVMERFGITKKEIKQDVAKLIEDTMRPDMAEFLSKYLNFVEDYKWHDTYIFKSDELSGLLDTTIDMIVKNIHWK